MYAYSVSMIVRPRRRLTSNPGVCVHARRKYWGSIKRTYRVRLENRLGLKHACEKHRLVHDGCVIANSY